MISIHKTILKKSLFLVIFSVLSHFAMAQPPYLDGTYNIVERVSTSDLGSNHYGDAVAVSDWSNDGFALVGNTLFRGDKTTNTWTKISDLLPSEGVAGSNYGSVVAISGSTIAIAAPNQAVGSLADAGKVYIFRQDMSDEEVWFYDQTLTMPVPKENYQFGYDLAIDGNNLVVGMKYKGTNAVPKGSAFVFEKLSINWSFKQELSPSVLNASYFGEAVAIEWNTIAVGAPNHSFRRGAGFIFKKNSSTLNWDQTYRTSLPTGESDNYDYMGLDVAIYSNTAVFGARTKPVNGKDSVGVAYVFKNASGTWGYLKRLTAPDGEENDRFGEKIVMQNNLICIAAPNDGDLGEANGSVYTFEEFTGGSGNWGFVRKLRPSNGADYDAFGSSLSVGEYGTLFVGGSGSANPAIIFEESITLDPTLPIVVNDEFQDILHSSFTLSGKTIDNGDIAVSDVGIVWSATNNAPTIHDDFSASAGGINAGDSFSATATGLQPNTFYYTRTYATNQEGTTYGAVLKQSTGSPASRLHYKSLVAEVSNGGSTFDLDRNKLALVAHPNNNFIYGVTYLVSSDFSVSLDFSIVAFERVGNTLNARYVVDGMSTIGADFRFISNMAISPDGNYLYAPSSDLEKLMVFDINSDGSLSLKQELDKGGTDASGSNIPGLTDPTDVTVSPDGKFVYVLSGNGPGSTTSEISVFSVNSTNGNLDFLEISALKDDSDADVNWGQTIKISPDGKQLIASAGAVELGGNAVVVFNRNAATGLLTRQFAYLGIDAINQDFVFSSSGAFVYGISNIEDNIKTFKRAADGSLSVIQTLGRNTGGINRRGLSYPSAIQIGVDGQIYVSSSSDGAIGIFDTNAVSGMLTYYEGKTNVIATINGANEDVMEGIQKIAVDPSGDYLFSASELSYNIFEIDQVAQIQPEILLSNLQIDEEQGANLKVGKLSINTNESATFSLVSGTSDTDNDLFTIASSGNLYLSENADFEVKQSYNIRVSASLSGGAVLQKAFTIQVTNINEAPTSISFSTTEITEDFAGGVLGELSAEDPDMLDDIVYYFIPGDNDNDDFLIDGNQVKTRPSFTLNGREKIVLAIEAVDTYGDGLSIADTFEIDVVYIPDCEVSILSSAEILCSSNSTITLDAGAGFTSYNWSTGDTTRVITINEAGTYGVEAINEDNCLATDSIIIEILEDIIIDLGEDIVQCDSTAVVLSPGTGYFSYEWSTGATTPEVTVDSSGVYSVSITTEEGCIFSDSIQVTIGEAPDAELTSYGFFLTASEGASYQWYFEGELLPDSTQSIVARRMGVYEVAVMTASGCESLSDELRVLVTANEESSIANTKVYPNPATNNLYIALPKDYKGKVDISVYSSKGELIVVKRKVPASSTLDVRNWTSGVYMIRLNSDGFEQTFKVFKK